ncbi:MAG: amino acid adenylation domain-containing protein, partial [bacterium]|nr:amino acid adenylation domain-containing protein [bacterium]
EQALPCTLTYKELNRESNTLAQLLVRRGVNGIVGIKSERTIHQIIGIMGILKSGCAYLPIAPDTPHERIRFMVKDSQMKVLLTEQSIGSDTLGDTVDILDPGETIRSAANGEEKQAENERVITESSDLAYIVYTSGTTGKPKGTLTCHYNITRIVLETEYIKVYPSDRLLQVSNYAFDGSLFNIYGALLNGAALVLTTREEVLAVEALGGIIKSENITLFFVSTALFNALVDLAPGSLAGLRKILIGGERASVAHCRGAVEHMGANKLINGYGPTETTFFATSYEISEVPENTPSIPIGRPLSNTTVYILDKYLNPVPFMVQGEVYIGGEGGARGYLNNPQLTAEKFITVPPGIAPKVPPGSPYKTLYKSGDLARRLMDGNIEFIGRADSQVKIRGFRIELEEIENQLLERDEVMECVVRAKTRADGEHYLCAYILFNQPAINVDMTKERVPGNIRETLSQTLPHYMIPAFFIPITHLPLTPNGKVDTKALPEPPDGEVATGATYIPPGNKIEERVAEIWSEILHIKKTAVSVDAVFFQVGGHSLKTTLMASKIHKAFDIKIPLSEVFKAPTIRGIADYLKNADKKKYASIKPVEKKEYYPVSSPQKRLYILQQMEPGDTGYNMPGVIPSADGPDKRELETIFQKLIARHESLRTSFHITNDGPVQRIHDKCDITIEEHKTTEKEVDSLLNAFTRPFDLSRAPLLRVALVEIAPSLRRVFFVDMHHIISDGTSVEILREEFFALCEGKEPAPIRLQYKDFSEWQAGAKQVEWVKQQELYWLNQFPDELPELNLPADYSRTRVRNFDGAEVSFVLHHSESRALKQVAGEAGATMYMLVLTLYTILLSKLSGREDIIVGTPVAARQHDDLQNIIGMFVNTLAMRNSPKGGKTFKEFLGEVKGRVLDAFENQEYQFGDLVEKVAPQRDTSRNPIFDVMLNLLNQREDNREIPEPQENDLNEHKKGVAKFDLTLTTVEKGEELLFNIDYSTQLFKAPTIDRFISYLRKIVSGITANKNIRIADLEILSEEEKKRILVDFNDTASKYPGHKRIHTLFEEQAAGKPESIALVCGEETLTYGELNGKANRLARTLINRGAGPNRITGVMLHRSPEMVIAILAILKTGGAYLPIDPSYPEERKKYMPADSGAQLIITRKSSESGTGGMDDDKIIDMDAPLLDAEDSNPDLASPGDLVYVIFTSGSTGKPKGAGVFHRGFVNLVHWYISEFELNADDGSLLLTSPSFDFTQKNIFAPLVTGAALHLPVTNYFDPASILHTIHQRQLTWLSSTPGMFYKLTEEIKEFKKLSSLRYVLLGGEAISIPVFNQWLESEECNAQVVNIYGPTECTDICAFYPITDPGRHLNGTVPIGKPISNARLYVLDSHLHPLPIGVTGEICIGGDGVGAGYINHIDLTADKFVEVSFTPNHTETIYRTGDLGKWLEGGNIEFLGRIDHQVKIRGFRIEMGEIENQLLKRENIKETVVIARGEGNDKYLCAYVVPNDDAQAAESLTPSALSDYLSSNLPDYMVPAFFIQLKQMPLNTNGKVNRGALPAPSITLGDDYTAPRDNIEKKLVGIWSRVLGIEKKQISIDANFFKSGGHSLKAT